MKKNLVIFAITAFLIADTYHDGKYTEKIKGGKKYFKMAMYAFAGLSMYLILKKNPNKAAGMMKNMTDIAKYMPIDSNTKDILTPFFDLTNDNKLFSGIRKTSGFDNMNNMYNQYSKQTNQMGNFNNNTAQFNRMMNSGKNSNKRSVSETKKKYVASQQGWKCNKCNQMLSASFEVDHKIELQFGGSNHVSNLAALCRNCHGDKTMQHKLI